MARRRESRTGNRHAPSHCWQTWPQCQRWSMGSVPGYGRGPSPPLEFQMRLRLNARLRVDSVFRSTFAVAFRYLKLSKGVNNP